MFTHKTTFEADHTHATAAEARACEAEWQAANDAHDMPCCSICDGNGHGYPGGGPCPLETSDIVGWETDQDEARAAALGLTFPPL